MIYLYGAGGHAKVIADIIESCGEIIGGVFDKDDTKRVWNYPYHPFPGTFNIDLDQLIISIGNNIIRKQIASTIPFKFYTAIHPKATVSRYVSIAEGTVIMGGALVDAGTTIGKHSVINSQASIDHDCIIHEYVHISPNATICGGIVIGELTHIGAGAAIIPGKKIGAKSIIGAGSVVITDIPDNVMAAGNPARIIKKLT